MVLGLTGAATSAIQRSRRDTPDPRPSRDCYHNHAPLQPRTPSYVDAHGRLPVRDCRTRGPPSSYPTPPYRTMAPLSSRMCITLDAAATQPLLNRELVPPQKQSPSEQHPLPT